MKSFMEALEPRDEWLQKFKWKKKASLGIHHAEAQADDDRNFRGGKILLIRTMYKFDQYELVI